MTAYNITLMFITSCQAGAGSGVGVGVGGGRLIVQGHKGWW